MVIWSMPIFVNRCKMPIKKRGFKLSFVHNLALIN